MSTASRSAAILIIGNEILSGRTQDKNLHWLAGQLAARGVKLVEARVVADVPEAIISAVNELRGRYEAVFTSGGIGPTHDDITSETIAAAFGVEYGMHPEARAVLEDYYKPEDRTEGRMKMAKMPLSARLIANPVSKAPGFVVENVYVMAGVPSVFQAMFASIAHEFDGGVPIVSETVMCMRREGDIAQALGELQGRYAAVEIGSYPFNREGRWGTNLVLSSQDAEALARAVAECRELFGEA